MIELSREEIKVYFDKAVNFYFKEYNNNINPSFELKLNDHILNNDVSNSFTIIYTFMYVKSDLRFDIFFECFPSTNQVIITLRNLDYKEPISNSKTLNDVGAIQDYFFKIDTKHYYEKALQYYKENKN